MMHDFQCTIFFLFSNLCSLFFSINGLAHSLAMALVGTAMGVVNDFLFAFTFFVFDGIKKGLGDWFVFRCTVRGVDRALRTDLYACELLCRSDQITFLDLYLVAAKFVGWIVDYGFSISTVHDPKLYWAPASKLDVLG